MLRALFQAYKETGSVQVMHLHVRDSFNKANPLAPAQRPKWNGPLPPVDGVEGLSFTSAEEDLITVFLSVFAVKADQEKVKCYRHCFLGKLEKARRWLEICPNSYFGLAPKAMWDHRCEKAFINLPISQILCETDAPMLHIPYPNRSVYIPKEEMTPCHVRYVYIYLAWLRNMDFDRLCNILKANFRRLYNL